MEIDKPKFEQQVDQLYETHRFENMPTLIRKQIIDETPNFYRLYDKEDEGINKKFYKEYENFANNCKQTSPTDISTKITKKKYETIKINEIDVTHLTNDS